MTCMQVTCPKCGTKYLRGVFDGGCPKCFKVGAKSWELIRHKEAND